MNEPDSTTTPSATASGKRSIEPEVHGYGPDYSQFGALYRPEGASRGTVVVIHGGYWKAQYGVEYATPLAEDLLRRGYTAWVPEYRRVGNGGGFPETFDDIDAGFELLTTLDVDTSALVVVGHSAGGHLAAWSAARRQHQRWAKPGRDRLTALIVQAGVLDFRAAVKDSLGADAVQALVGPPSDRYPLVDPSAQGPLGAPVWCLHARDDDVVPFSQSADYVAYVRAQGGRAKLVAVPGGHFGLIDPEGPGWAQAVKIIESVSAKG